MFFVCSGFLVLQAYCFHSLSNFFSSFLLSVSLQICVRRCICAEGAVSNELLGWEKEDRSLLKLKEKGGGGSLR